MKTATEQHWTETEFGEALNHLERMSREPGFKHHAWERAKELDKAEHGMYRGIKAALVEQMKTNTEETTA